MTMDYGANAEAAQIRYSGAGYPTPPNVEITRSRVVAATGRLQQIDQDIVDQLRSLEDTLDRLLGGRPQPAPPPSPMAPGNRPIGCAVDDLDAVVHLFGERLVWLAKLVDRAQEI